MVFTIDQSVRPLDPRRESDYWVIGPTEIWLIARCKPDVNWELPMHITASMCLFLLRASEIPSSASVMCDFQTRPQRQVSNLWLSVAVQVDKPKYVKLFSKWSGLKVK